ncbi:hypothetical protein ACI65C_004291 [Semiaphis heraclei]
MIRPGADRPLLKINAVPSVFPSFPTYYQSKNKKPRKPPTLRTITNEVPIPAGAETIKFIRTIDRIFDFLNTRNPYGKGYKKPLYKSDIGNMKKTIIPNESVFEIRWAKRNSADTCYLHDESILEKTEKEKEIPDIFMNEADGFRMSCHEIVLFHHVKRDTHLPGLLTFNICSKLEQIESLQLVGCDLHAHGLTSSLVNFFLIIRVHFICSRSNSIDNAKKEKSKLHRKSAKLI